MTPQEYSVELERKLTELKAFNRPFQLAVYSTVALVSKRVFTDGRNKEGNQFQYKSKWYKQKREKRGFETAFVNWTYEGELKSDYENYPKGQGATALKVSVNEYESALVRQIDVDKYSGLSKRFGEFLEVNDEEERKFYEINELELRLLFEK